MLLLAQPVAVKLPLLPLFRDYMILPKERYCLTKTFPFVAYAAEDRAQKFGFSYFRNLFYFTGTIRDNILYGNSYYDNYTNEQTEQLIKDKPCAI